MRDSAPHLLHAVRQFLPPRVWLAIGGEAAVRDALADLLPPLLQWQSSRAPSTRLVSSDPANVTPAFEGTTWAYLPRFAREAQVARTISATASSQPYTGSVSWLGHRKTYGPFSTPEEVHGAIQADYDRYFALLPAAKMRTILAEEETNAITALGRHYTLPPALLALFHTHRDVPDRSAYFRGWLEWLDTGTAHTDAPRGILRAMIVTDHLRPLWQALNIPLRALRELPPETISDTLYRAPGSTTDEYVVIPNRTTLRFADIAHEPRSERGQTTYLDVLLRVRHPEWGDTSVIARPYTLASGIAKGKPNRIEVTSKDYEAHITPDGIITVSDEPGRKRRAALAAEQDKQAATRAIHDAAGGATAVDNAWSALHPLRVEWYKVAHPDADTATHAGPINDYWRTILARWLMGDEEAGTDLFDPHYARPSRTYAAVLAKLDAFRVAHMQAIKEPQAAWEVVDDTTIKLRRPQPAPGFYFGAITRTEGGYRVMPYDRHDRPISEDSASVTGDLYANALPFQGQQNAQHILEVYAGVRVPDREDITMGVRYIGRDPDLAYAILDPGLPGTERIREIIANVHPANPEVIRKVFPRITDVTPWKDAAHTALVRRIDKNIRDVSAKILGTIRSTPAYRDTVEQRHIANLVGRAIAGRPAEDIQARLILTDLNAVAHLPAPTSAYYDDEDCAVHPVAAFGVLIRNLGKLDTPVSEDDAPATWTEAYFTFVRVGDRHAVLSGPYETQLAAAYALPIDKMRVHEDYAKDVAFSAAFGTVRAPRTAADTVKFPNHVALWRHLLQALAAQPHMQGVIDNPTNARDTVLAVLLSALEHAPLDHLTPGEEAVLDKHRAIWINTVASAYAQGLRPPTPPERPEWATPPKLAAPASPAEIPAAEIPAPATRDRLPADLDAQRFTAQDPTRDIVRQAHAAATHAIEALVPARLREAAQAERGWKIAMGYVARRTSDADRPAVLSGFTDAYRRTFIAPTPSLDAHLDPVPTTPDQLADALARLTVGTGVAWGAKAARVSPSAPWEVTVTYVIPGLKPQTASQDGKTQKAAIYYLLSGGSLVRAVYGMLLDPYLGAGNDKALAWLDPQREDNERATHVRDQQARDQHAQQRVALATALLARGWREGYADSFMWDYKDPGFTDIAGTRPPSVHSYTLTIAADGKVAIEAGIDHSIPVGTLAEPEATAEHATTWVRQNIVHLHKQDTSLVKPPAPPAPAAPVLPEIPSPPYVRIAGMTSGDSAARVDGVTEKYGKAAYAITYADGNTGWAYVADTTPEPSPYPYWTDLGGVGGYHVILSDDSDSAGARHRFLRTPTRDAAEAEVRRNIEEHADTTSRASIRVPGGETVRTYKRDGAVWRVAGHGEANRKLSSWPVFWRPAGTADEPRKKVGAQIPDDLLAGLSAPAKQRFLAAQQALQEGAQPRPGDPNYTTLRRLAVRNAKTVYVYESADADAIILAHEADGRTKNRISVPRADFLALMAGERKQWSFGKGFALYWMDAKRLEADERAKIQREAADAQHDASENAYRALLAEAGAAIADDDPAIKLHRWGLVALTGSAPGEKALEAPKLLVYLLRQGKLHPQLIDLLTHDNEISHLLFAWETGHALPETQKLRAQALAAYPNIQHLDSITHAEIEKRIEAIEAREMRKRERSEHSGDDNAKGRALQTKLVHAYGRLIGARRGAQSHTPTVDRLYAAYERALNAVLTHYNVQALDSASQQGLERMATAWWDARIFKGAGVDW